MAWTAEMSRTAFITPRGSFVRGWSMRTEMAIDQTPADSSYVTRAPVASDFFIVSGFCEVPPMSMPFVQALTHHSSSLWTKSDVMLLMAALYPPLSVKNTSLNTFDRASWSFRYCVVAGMGFSVRVAFISSSMRSTIFWSWVISG